MHASIGFMHSQDVLDHTPRMFMYTGIVWIIVMAVCIACISLPHPRKQIMGEMTPLTHRTSLTLSQSTKTRKFWQLFAIAFSNFLASFWLISSWKVFANMALGIEDDRFLSIIGAVAGIATKVSRLSLSLAYDFCFPGSAGRLFGAQQVLVVIGFLGSAALAIDPAGMHQGDLKTYFAISLCLIFNGCTAVVMFFPNIVARVFGDEYAAEICGVMYATEGPSMIMSAVLMSLVPSVLSWATVQILAGVCSATAAILLFTLDVTPEKAAKEIPKKVESAEPELVDSIASWLTPQHTIYSSVSTMQHSYFQ
jgi:hypothetical protein